MKPLIAATAVLLALSACANSQEAKVARGLADLGLPYGLSECMAERMVDQLSYGQLSRLANFAETLDEDIDDMSVGDLAMNFGALGDGETVSVMVRSAAGCAIAG